MLLTAAGAPARSTITLKTTTIAATINGHFRISFKAILPDYLEGMKSIATPFPRVRAEGAAASVTATRQSGYLGASTAGCPRLSKNCWFSRTEQICWYRKKPVRESVKLRRAFHGFV